MGGLVRLSTLAWAVFAGAVSAVALSYTNSLCGLVGFFAPCFLAFSLKSGTRSQNLVNSLSYGLCGWILSAWWLGTGINAMNQSYWWAGPLGVGVLATLSAIPYLLFGALCHPCTLFGPTTARPFCASALLTLLVELWPAKFPGSLANALASATALIQIAELGGTPIVHFVVYAVGFSMASLFVKSPRTLDHTRSVLISFLMLIALGIYGFLRLNVLRQGFTDLQPIQIGMVQPNLPIKGATVNYGDPGSIESLYSQTVQLLEHKPQPELIVWPEIPVYFSPFNNPNDKEALNSLLRGHDTPLLLNADMFSNEMINGRVPFYNVEQLFRDSGEVFQEYRKMILVPLGEYLPFEEYLSGPRFERILSELRRYVPGREVSLFQISPQLTVGTPICLEALHSDHIFDMIQKGANVLVNPANDGYFGASSGASLNLTFSIFRAIEFRVPVVRVTNSGISVAINQLGEIIQGSQMEQFSADQRLVSVYPKQGNTRSTHPRLQGIGLLALFALACLISNFRERPADE